jgi:hypothetical protein
MYVYTYIHTYVHTEREREREREREKERERERERERQTHKTHLLRFLLLYQRGPTTESPATVAPVAPCQCLFKAP